jgi:hypothetical protein
MVMTAGALRIPDEVGHRFRFDLGHSNQKSAAPRGWQVRRRSWAGLIVVLKPEPPFAINSAARKGAADAFHGVAPGACPSNDLDRLGLLSELLRDWRGLRFSGAAEGLYLEARNAKFGPPPCRFPRNKLEYEESL